MKVIQINSVYGIGSTGRIAMDLHDYMKSVGVQVKTIYGYGKGNFVDAYKMQGMIELRYNIALSRITGKHGYYNKHATKKAIDFLDREKPDIIHLHNIHGYYINVPMLMNYIKEHHIPVIWTFHDCWPFTGYCAHFDSYGCGKWKTGCVGCKAWGKEYTIIASNQASINWIRKQQMFSFLEKCYLVSPSKWLADFWGDSFISEYKGFVIHNGIDTELFKPTKGDLKRKLGIGRKKIVLGISPNLDGTKGGRYLIRLAQALGDEYAVVILSLNTRESLPKNVLVLPKTNKKKELAEIYSMADVFVNPTLLDNYPTVNLEATACGTPVVTFDTGGSPEGITEGFGAVVEKGNLNELEKAVRWVVDHNIKEKYRDIDVNALSISCFAEKYLELYKKILDER